MNVINANAPQLRKSLPRKKADRDRTNMMVDHNALSNGRERPFEYWEGAYIDIGIGFYLLWGKIITLVVWLHTIGRQRIIR